jgi:hypothetical protein
MEESKLVSSDPFMVNPRHLVHQFIFAMLLSAASATCAYAQGQFTLTPSALSPPALDPGNSAVGSISVQLVGTFNGTVTLTCTVSSNSVTVNLPGCSISPDSVVPPAAPPITITTCGGASGTCTGATPPGVYTILVTGTGGTTTATATISINVVAGVAEDYTLLAQPTTASPPAVNAGNSATTTITVTPIGNYSGHQVTLACLSITPVVVAEPYCTFQYPNGAQFVQVVSGTPATATLTIVTLGPVPTQTENIREHRGLFYAFFLAMPGLALIGVRTRRRSAKLTIFLGLIMIAGSILLLPACGSTTTNNPNGQTTPKGTYTFTLTASDETGIGPANSTTDPATVTLTVNN